MGYLQKIVVLCLFIAVVAIGIFIGFQKNKEMNARKGPGPQVPAEQVEQSVSQMEIGSHEGSGSAKEPLLGNGDDVATSSEVGDEGLVTCTADAQICPDGSAVSRTGPDCSFPACPKQTITVSKRCTAQQKQAQACTMQYAPVCGLVEVQCVTTPCNPVPETFGNACSACAQGNVISYTEGECRF